MSTVGKIFIILNLVLAAAFVGYASKELKVSEDYRTRFQREEVGHRETRESLSAQVQELDSQLGAAKQQSVLLTNERDTEKARADRVAGELADEKRNGQKLSGDMTAVKEKLADYNKQLEALASAKDRAVDTARAAEKERDQAQDAARNAELAMRDARDTAGSLEAKVAELEGSLAASSKELKHKQVELDTLVAVTGVNVSDIAAQPQIEAAVLGVKMDVQPGLVMLNVGRNKEVKPGMTFDIYQGNKYKGRVRVQNVEESFCSALITMSQPGAVIAQGDRASTRL